MLNKINYYIESLSMQKILFVIVPSSIILLIRYSDKLTPILKKALLLINRKSPIIINESFFSETFYFDAEKDNELPFNMALKNISENDLFDLEISICLDSESLTQLDVFIEQEQIYHIDVPSLMIIDLDYTKLYNFSYVGNVAKYPKNFIVRKHIDTLEAKSELSLSRYDLENLNYLVFYSYIKYTRNNQSTPYRLKFKLEVTYRKLYHRKPRKTAFNLEAVCVDQEFGYFKNEPYIKRIGIKFNKF